VLLAAKETQRLDQTKVKLGTRHGNAEDAAFFFDLLGRAAEPRYVLQSPELVENCVGLYVPLLEFNQWWMPASVNRAARCELNT
jgi:hypothetical protein